MWGLGETGAPATRGGVGGRVGFNLPLFNYRSNPLPPLSPSLWLSKCEKKEGERGRRQLSTFAPPLAPLLLFQLFCATASALLSLSFLSPGSQSRSMHFALFPPFLPFSWQTDEGEGGRKYDLDPVCLPAPDSRKKNRDKNARLLIPFPCTAERFFSAVARITTRN